ncbi:MAG TPA: DUF6159 family protein [Planctomycetota bacterium]|jgi:hypothetical protein|nr:DUF6159 family protein [Planctomycetota bacterium]
MFGSFSRSYQLVRASWAILRQDKEIIIFPILSGAISIVLAASFLVPLVLFAQHDPADHRIRIDFWWYLFTFLFYLVSSFITIFFNVGVMHCASVRMSGSDPTIAEGFHGAISNVVPIIVWSLLSATVGVLLRILEQRLALVGRIVVSMLGLGWSFLTYFAVPVMIFEGKSAGRAMKRSAELFKRTWGESVVGQAGLGVFFGWLALAGAVPVALAVFLAAQGALGAAVATLIISVAIFYWIALAAISTALKGIFNVALYRFASTGQAGGFPPELIAGHWTTKT